MTGAECTADWTVETAIDVTKELQNGAGIRSSIWVTVTDAAGEIDNYSILQYKYSLGETSGEDDTTEPVKEPVFQIYTKEGQWVNVDGLDASLGTHALKMQFHEGTLTQYIDGVLVQSYTLSETMTAPRDVIFNSKTFGDNYTTRWTTPVIRYTKGISDDCAVVTTAQELIDAAAKGGEVVLGSDIALSTRLNVYEDFVLYGKGHTIFTENWTGTSNEDKHLIGIGNGADVTLSDVRLDCGGNAYGVNIYDNQAGVCKMEQVEILDSKGSGITVNGSILEAAGLSISGSGWKQSIDVTSKVDAASKLVLDDASQLEEYAIVEDGAAAAVVEVGGQAWKADAFVSADGSKFIYSKDATGNRYAVADAESLETVLEEADAGAEITLLDDLTVMVDAPSNNSAFVITKDVTIDGNGKSITTNAAGFYIMDDANVKITDLTLTGEGADGAETGTAWMGIGTYNQNKNVHLTMENSKIIGFNFGLYFGLDSSAEKMATTSLEFLTVEIKDCVTKGLYAENLTDSRFESCLFIQNGAEEASGLPEYAKNFLAGIDINLKYGDYSSIQFFDCGFERNGMNQGGALLVKARDDGSYSSRPATLDGVTIRDCRFSGNEKDVMLGEPGKENETPTGVMLDGVLVTGSISDGEVRVEDNRKQAESTLEEMAETR